MPNQRSWRPSRREDHLTWVDELFASVASLKDHPRRGRKVPEVNRPEAREIIHGAYRVIYRVDPKRLVILTVRHGRRQWDPTEVDD